MQFQHATFARSGRSVRIADGSTPYEFTLAWLVCLYMQAYSEAWLKETSVTPLNDKRFRQLNYSVIAGLGGPRNPNLDLYLAQATTGRMYFGLASNIEQRAFLLPPMLPALAGTASVTWFNRRSLNGYVEVPGYTRGFSFVEELVAALNRNLMSFYNPDPVSSFVKRVVPLLGDLRACNTPGARFAADLVESLEHWDHQSDRALVLTP